MNIGIAGAGLMGRLLGWQLLRQGHTVTLFDRDRRDGDGSAAFVAAAMLAPLSESVTSDAAVYDWGCGAPEQWLGLLQQLGEDSGIQVELNQTGSVVVAHALDASTMQHFERQLRQKVPTAAREVVQLDRTALAELEPELAERFQQGLLLRSEACLDNRALLRALDQAIVRRGGVWRERTEVTAIGSKVIVTADGDQRFDLVIDCRGFGAKSQWPGLRGVRGELLWVKAPEVNLSRPVRLMHPRYHLYITPKPDSVYVVGATEIESESQAPVTVRSQLELLSALYSMHRGFAEAEILGSFARCRPALADNLPQLQIGAGLLKLNGLYRHGYLLGPTLLQAALQTIAGNTDHPWVKQHD